MSDERRFSTSRFGALLVVAAVGGSAVAVVGWYLLSNRGGNPLDTSGFDLNTAADGAIRRGSAGNGGSDAGHSDSTHRWRATPEPSSLGMLKPGTGLRVLSAGIPLSGERREESATSAAASRKEKAERGLKEAAIKHEKFFAALGRRMEAKYPSLTRYGEDWVSYPDLRALRDQYWRDRDPVKFAYGMVKSDNFGKLLKKYSNDPGARAFLAEAIKQAPADLRSAVGQVFRNNYVVKDLINAVGKSLDLPPSLTSFLGGDGTRPPDRRR